MGQGQGHGQQKGQKYIFGHNIGTIYDGHMKQKPFCSSYRARSDINLDLWPCFSSAQGQIWLCLT